MNDMITIILSFQSPLCLRGGVVFFYSLCENKTVTSLHALSG